MERVIPEFLINKIKEQYNKEESELILNGLVKNKKSSFRINRIKSNMEEIKNILKENNIKFFENNFFKDAFIIDKFNENKVKELEIYKNGKIYFQNLSAMIPVIILNPKEKENILDMCAAPRRKNNSNSEYYK